MQIIVIVVHIIVFDCITINGDLIDCDSPFDNKSFANYTYLVMQKIAIEIIINFIVRGFIIYINTIG